MSLSSFVVAHVKEVPPFNHSSLLEHLGFQFGAVMEMKLMSSHVQDFM